MPVVGVVEKKFEKSGGVNVNDDRSLETYEPERCLEVGVRKAERGDALEQIWQGGVAQGLGDVRDVFDRAALARREHGGRL